MVLAGGVTSALACPLGIVHEQRRLPAPPKLHRPAAGPTGEFGTRSVSAINSNVKAHGSFMAAKKLDFAELLIRQGTISSEQLSEAKRVSKTSEKKVPA